MNSTESLTVLISTSNKRLRDIVIPPPVEGVFYIIIHQVYDVDLCKIFEQEYDSTRPDLKYYQVNSRGLAKSRNLAISLASTRYAYIMDDDVVINLSNIIKLSSWMRFNNVDVASCCFQYDDDSLPKNYKKTPFKHNLLSAARVSSIELCINVKSINDRGILFDERFGLGAALPSGEEYIFVTDCIKSGLNVWFYPITVGIHPLYTSGMDFYSTSAKVSAKREMLIRIFGNFGGLFIFIFWLKKLPIVLNKGYFLSFTKNLFFCKV